jgi:poly(3-hydroxybutyrate) depolymerase
MRKSDSHRKVVAILAATTVLLSCSGPNIESATVGQMSRHTIRHDGLEREYFVYLPQGYANGSELPVVFFLHGYGGSATGTEAETTNGLNRYAEDYGYIMVYPQGTWFWSDGSSDDRWEVTSFNHVSSTFDEGPEGPLCTPDAVKYPCPPECGECGRCAWISCHDDLGFLEKLFETTATDLKVDRRRFYLSGFSSGSMMAQYVGCEASDWFAAVALVGGRVPRGYQCSPTKSLPLLQITGARDETVPNDGRAASDGFFYSTTDATAIQWNEGTGCADEAQPWSNVITEENGLQCSAACADTDRESIDCLWPAGDHHWPGYPAGHGTNGYCVTALQQASMPEQTPCVEPDIEVDVWGSRLVFEFFESHQ